MASTGCYLFGSMSLTMSIAGTNMKIVLNTTNSVKEVTMLDGTDYYSFGCSSIVILKETW